MAVEKIKISIEWELNTKSFQKAGDQAVMLARDTKKKLDPLLVNDLRINLANLQSKLDEARNRLKQAKKEWDKDTEFKARMDVNKLQSDTTEAKRILNNYVNTGEKWVSRLQAKFDQIWQFARNTFWQIGVAIVTAFWIKAIGWFINSIDEARKSIWELTGAVGWQLNWLMKDFSATLSKVEDSSADVAKAIWEINTRFWVTGKPLQDLTIQFLNFADVTNQDVQTSIRDLSRLLQDSWYWLGRATELMDILTVASQKTGISVGTLATNSTNFWVQLRALWFSLEESVALISKFEAEWVNTEAILAWLNKWLNTLAKKSWIDIPTAFTSFIDSLKNAKSDSEALSIASETLGAKAWPQLALAVREGRFELESYLLALQWSAGTTERTALATETVAEKFSRLWNAVKSNLIPVVNSLLEFLNPILERFATFISENPKLTAGITATTVAVWLLAGAMLVLWWPITAIIAWLTALVGIWIETKRRFDNMTEAIRLYRDWITDANWNLTDFWKKIQKIKDDLIDYKKQQDRVNSALDVYNKIKVDSSRTREQFDLARKAALAEADALLKSAKAYLARAYAAKEVNRLTQWWIWWSPVKSWLDAINDINIKTKEQEVSSLLKTIEDLNKSVYTAPKGGGGWGVLSSDWGKKSVNELQEAFQTAFESINWDIDKSAQKIGDYKKQIEDLETALVNLDKSRDSDISKRVAKIDEELKKTGEQALSTEEKAKLEAEKAEAFAWLTDAEIIALQEKIDKQKAYNELTEIWKIKADYEEKKKVMQDDLDEKTKLLKLEEQAEAELVAAKEILQQQYNENYKKILQEQIGLQVQLKKAALEAARAMAGGGWGSWNNTVNNNQKITTVNANISSTIWLDSLVRKISK